MRTSREVRADLAVVNDQIEAYWASSGEHYCDEFNTLDRKRKRLEAELAGILEADRAHPVLDGLEEA